MFIHIHPDCFVVNVLSIEKILKIVKLKILINQYNHIDTDNT